MRIQRLNLLRTHLRTISNFPDYNALIAAQSSGYTRVPKSSIRRFKEIKPATRIFRKGMCKK